MPQNSEPEPEPWCVPLPALGGSGASVWVHVLPVCVSIRPHAWSDVS